jgi:hypothetical protein
VRIAVCAMNTHDRERDQPEGGHVERERERSEATVDDLQVTPAEPPYSFSSSSSSSSCRVLFLRDLATIDSWDTSFSVGGIVVSFPNWKPPAYPQNS